MKINTHCTSALILLAGCVSGLVAGDERPTVHAPASGQIKQAAHIYFNVATGERVVTLLGERAVGERGDGLVDSDIVESAGGSSGPIWTTVPVASCPANSGTSSIFFVADDNSPGGTQFSTGAEFVDFGDIALDSVVDMVHIEWIVAHSDTDLNSDGIGDGVDGLGGQWTYWDAEDGRANNSSTRLPLISLLFADLPGNLSGSGFLTGYSADIDLEGVTSETSFTFELGDSDGVSSAEFFNNDVDTDGDGIGDGVSVANADRDLDGLPDGDLDGDGLFDWGWSVRFFQPGTADLDGDGVVDGDLANSGEPIGLSFGLPAGAWVDQGDGTWDWELGPVTPTDFAYGAVDRVAIYDDGVYATSFSFGGPACGPEGFTPMAQFEMQLVGPRGGDACCPPDRNCDGQLNFFDVSLFLSEFSGNDDYNGDGSTNFFDVSQFLADFSAGCP